MSMCQQCLSLFFPFLLLSAFIILFCFSALCGGVYDATEAASAVKVGAVVVVVVMAAVVALWLQY